MKSAREQEIRKRINIKPYLAELGTLIRREVREAELLSLEQTQLMRQRVPTEPRLRFTLSFAERLSRRFRAFVRTLAVANPSPIIIWPPRANDCGAFEIESLRAINFEFPIDLNPVGVLAIVAADGRDQLLLDFGEDEGTQVLAVEVRGKNWTQAAAEFQKEWRLQS